MAGRQIPLGESVARKLRDIAARMDGSLEVGFLEGATYPDGTPVASVAFWNEFGTTRTVAGEDGEESKVEHSPPRPFFRTMVANESPAWPDKIATLAGASDTDLNYNGAKILALMGEDIQGALIKSINDFTSPRNAESTIKRKGFDKPLIDGSHMVNSTGYRVIKR